MLVDTNILVAASVEAHPAHDEAIELLRSDRTFVVAAHSLAELYNTLTKPVGYGWSATVARSQIGAIQVGTKIVSLTAAQTINAIDEFAAHGGGGARLYDRIIGEHAIASGVARLATFNVRHMTTLFPTLVVGTPRSFLESV